MNPIILAAIVFHSQFLCVQHLNKEATNRPEHSTVSERTIQSAVIRNADEQRATISLYGANAVLMCKEGNYTVTLLGE